MYISKAPFVNLFKKKKKKSKLEKVSDTLSGSAIQGEINIGIEDKNVRITGVRVWFKKKF